ncbi:MAG: hypothetical protein PUF37_05780 [Prevotellaceae bacterium]|nr:hypothetical protein [Prevotellaceae bacterium]
MAKCTEKASIYEDLEKCPGQKKLPGIRDYVYGISIHDLVAFPTIPDAPASLKEAVTYKGDFTPAADAYFHKVGIVKNEGQMQVENQGTDGCKTFKETLTIAIPGTEEEATGYIDQANNDEMIYIFFQRNGKARVIGSEDFSPELSLKQDTGKTATDANTTTVEAVCTDLHPAPFYVGKIHTKDGDIDGATGKIAASTSTSTSGTSSGTSTTTGK